MGGVPVTFAVAAGAGTITGAAATTNSSGIATIGSWTLGTVAGSNTLIASAGSLPSVTFSATGVAGPPASLSKNAGDLQTAVAGAAVSVPPSVIVKDINGNVVSNVSVTFAVVGGGGIISSTTSLTNSLGIATLASWTLGTTAGTNSISATVGSLAAITFSASGVAGSPASIAKSAGDNQTGIAGSALPTPLSVIVKDVNNNVVSGASVTFALSAGAGTITGAAAVTNVSGIAALTAWTLGTKVGVNTVTASVSTLAPVSFSATGIAGPPAILMKSAGDGQTAVVATAVLIAPSVSVTDINGNAVSGTVVNFLVSSGGGSAAGASSTTNSLGIAALTSWTLGTTAGTNGMSAAVSGLTPAVFTATGIAGPPASITTESGGGQSALAGTLLSPISVKVKDQFGNAVSNVGVTISVSAGGGSVSPSSAITDATGAVGTIQWRLGKSAVAQALSVITGSAITASVSATVATSYPVDVRFFGPAVSSANQAVFQNAVAQIRGIITGSLTTVSVTNLNLETNCGVTGVTISEIINGVLIYAQVKPIDGPGKTLASAGPCLIRSSSRLTVIGVMQFDVDDFPGLAATGQLQDVVQHEMLHVIGIGTLWDQKTPSLLIGASSLDPRFSGSQGLAACTAAGGTSLCTNGIAVENCVGIAGCGAGTRDAHWREGTTTLAGFRTELMTGYAEAPGVVSPLSNITVQSLADLGYVVNSSAADSYTVPSPTIRSLVGPQAEQSWDRREILLKPRGTITTNGFVQLSDPQQWRE